ncbi:MAG: hypothetical protein BJ554DRAFT_4769 [Olpidium bornovanus]|uniref:Uncharacterized protein n=1 Tax=Olpidium bornovanus TaxID=278681 RepID=A0A8H8DEM2_9FUNG|nr:MAG: hypothetical protein BJ554DRAFT_4769 [Olpidium bornovanus]
MTIIHRRRAMLLIERDFDVAALVSPWPRYPRCPGYRRLTTKFPARRLPSIVAPQTASAR